MKTTKDFYIEEFNQDHKTYFDEVYNQYLAEMDETEPPFGHLGWEPYPDARDIDNEYVDRGFTGD